MQESWFYFPRSLAAPKQNFDGKVYNLYASRMVPELPYRQTGNKDCESYTFGHGMYECFRSTRK